jgi:hypothetical protein
MRYKEQSLLGYEYVHDEPHTGSKFKARLAYTKSE